MYLLNHMLLHADTYILLLIHACTHTCIYRYLGTRQKQNGQTRLTRGAHICISMYIETRILFKYIVYMYIHICICIYLIREFGLTKSLLGTHLPLMKTKTFVTQSPVHNFYAVEPAPRLSDCDVSQCRQHCFTLL